MVIVLCKNFEFLVRTDDHKLSFRYSQAKLVGLQPAVKSLQCLQLVISVGPAVKLLLFLYLFQVFKDFPQQKEQTQSLKKVQAHCLQHPQFRQMAASDMETLTNWETPKLVYFQHRMIELSILSRKQRGKAGKQFKKKALNFSKYSKAL